MTTAALYEQLPAEIKTWLTEEKPVFETMSVNDIYELLNTCRRLYPAIELWAPFVEFCRVQAKAVATQSDYTSSGWIRSVASSVKVTNDTFDLEHVVVIVLEGKIAGYFCYNNDDENKSAMWSMASEAWLPLPASRQYVIGAGNIRKTIKADKLIAAYKQGQGTIQFSIQKRGEHKDKSVPTLKKSRSIMEASISLQHIPDDAVEIIETLFGIAGTVNILEPNLHRWRQRMDELFPGQFKKGEKE